MRVINFFQREQAAPLLYILGNTYLGEQCTALVKKAGDLVQAFIGASVIVDGANLGGAAHRIRLFWTNMLQPVVLQATLPTQILPSPSLSAILKPYHIPTKPGHSDRPLPWSIK